MTDEVMDQVAALAEEYRDQCLWFLQDGFAPSNTDEALRVLDLIERYGDRSGFLRAQRLKKWLLRPSSVES